MSGLSLVNRAPRPSTSPGRSPSARELLEILLEASGGGTSAGPPDIPFKPAIPSVPVPGSANEHLDGLADAVVEALEKKIFERMQANWDED